MFPPIGRVRLYAYAPYSPGVLEAVSFLCASAPRDDLDVLRVYARDVAISIDGAGHLYVWAPRDFDTARLIEHYGLYPSWERIL